jgi:hypothetical protein
MQFWLASRHGKFMDPRRCATCGGRHQNYRTDQGDGIAGWRHLRAADHRADPPRGLVWPSPLYPLLLIGLLALPAGCPYQLLDDEDYCTDTAASTGPHCQDWRERHWQ